jgi:nicotinate-nucleotide adenylyltransferase
VVHTAQRIGIFGGTFDPIHVGHMVAALEARHQLRLDRVLLVVARDPWQKHGRVVASAESRWEMVTAATEGIVGLEASAIELERPGPTYTIDTVEQLAAPDRELFLILGADAAARLEGWHRAEDLCAAVTVATVGRTSDAADALGSGWTRASVSMPRLDISSTDVRARVARGAPIDFLVPAGVILVIRERHLYTPM